MCIHPDEIQGMTSSTKRLRWRYRWAIAIYGGPSPLALRPRDARDRPAFTAKDVTDIDCQSVADPFLVRQGDEWLLFSEVWNGEADRGELAVASSADLESWRYGGVVLREPFHLS